MRQTFRKEIINTSDMHDCLNLAVTNQDINADAQYLLQKRFDAHLNEEYHELICNRKDCYKCQSIEEGYAN